MNRIAAPMVGGLATSFLMEFLVYPVLYERWKSRGLSLEPANAGLESLEPTCSGRF